MKVKAVFVAVLLAMACSLSVTQLFAADGSQTLTGKVSDAMCGAKHAMAGKDADCTRAVSITAAGNSPASESRARPA